MRVSAPDAPLASGAGAPTLTRLTAFGTLSRQAGEGLFAAARPHAAGMPGIGMKRGSFFIDWIQRRIFA